MNATILTRRAGGVGGELDAIRSGLIPVLYVLVQASTAETGWQSVAPPQSEDI